MAIAWASSSSLVWMRDIVGIDARNEPGAPFELD
jgi:hypothetical protein